MHGTKTLWTAAALAFTGSIFTPLVAQSNELSSKQQHIRKVLFQMVLAGECQKKFGDTGLLERAKAAFVEAASDVDEATGAEMKAKAEQFFKQGGQPELAVLADKATCERIKMSLDKA